MHRDRKGIIRLLTASLAIGLVAIYVVGSASAAGARLRVGSATAIPSGAALTGTLPAATKVQLSISLRSQDPISMQSFATSVSTPGSPDFHHYLTVSQFAQRFGATDAQIAAVQSSLRSEGLTVGTPFGNHLLLQASGTAAQVQHAFATKLSQVKLPSGRVTYANTIAPTLSPSIAPYVQGVVGLDNLIVAQPEGLGRAHSSRQLVPNHAEPNVVTGGPQPCSVASETAVDSGYTADTIASAYNFSSLYGAGDLGAGQTVALYELEPYNSEDVATYQACYGTSVPITNINVDSAPAYTPGAGDGEVALDIEQVIGLAPAAKIQVYQTPNTAAGQLAGYGAIVSTDQAQVTSSSWGICEAIADSDGGTFVGSENSLFQEAAAQGQSIYVASGDAGSAACSQANPSNTSLSVQDPSSQPFITGVGGTTLYSINSSGTAVFWAPGDALDQSVWNDGHPNGGASGSTGGISAHWAMPSYQSGAASSVGAINANSSGTPCAQTAPTLCREVPDVSADADEDTGYVVNSTAKGAAAGTWGVIGGTSAAAPLWAAYTALVNASAPCRGIPVGFVNPALYQLAGSAYASNISDVTLASPISGKANNDALGTNGGKFPVTAGYDMATGLGTPIAPALASSLCAAVSPVYTISVGSPGAQLSTVGKPASLQLNASDSGGAGVTYAAANLPAGLSMNASSGLISGTPTTVGTTAVTVSASDHFANAGAIQFAWTILNPPLPAVGRPTFSKESLTGLTKHKPKLSFTVTAGSNAPALKSVAVSLPRGVKFAKKSKKVAKGISVKSNGGRVKFTEKVRHGLLTITFKRFVGSAKVTIGKPALSVSRSLASKVRRHKTKKLSMSLRATDTGNTTTKFTAKLKV